MGNTAAIILGHAIVGNDFSKRQRKRLDRALRLWQENKVEFLITTSGYGRLFNRSTHALGDRMKEYLISRGVPQDKVLNEKRSRNTKENAFFSLPLVMDQNVTEVFLVTSYPHSLRAEKIFRAIYPKNIMIHTVVSDVWTGLWTPWDLFWELMGWLKLGITSLRNRF
ncbi:MAG: hypothetical protein A3J46_00265 [Candidatus Yanofskybacteria bacterium RIFCSPHIGHO2_02_FULL_41_11]|uniref:DUF218 domain-containing protein n=1 Tax=Candidatus Yanofskybacteria bacterium RIFCSPHIGHO2_02_FULL_41_11 TaxID=1802675 RepID=A0A1F8F930_9BACT|nr:MAG: hypothetical protein UW86_C0007G0018 [Microgenomates group bacterium GW2011_GWA1_Microgenomates_45_10]OGN09040.1 MAG: hypothetical protein A3J46_00265 [Candidatus Yanofskybacteria bacterium RIFCSPHIGHO2_02_FULL_41_11]